MDKVLRELVRKRAMDRCEYCHVHQDDDSFYRFAVDHIIAEQHGGQTVAGNLALSCFRCNLHKGPNIAGRDRKSKKLVPLFHPRRHKCRTILLGTGRDSSDGPQSVASPSQFWP